MNDNFKTILDTLVGEGFHNLTKDGEPLEYKITPYSLNTKLSFKFDNLDHFAEFFKLQENEFMDEKIAVLQATFTELGLNPNEFFYVNFFESVKTQE